MIKLYEYNYNSWLLAADAAVIVHNNNNNGSCLQLQDSAESSPWANKHELLSRVEETPQQLTARITS